jgi:hypothetical protein
MLTGMFVISGFRYDVEICVLLCDITQRRVINIYRLLGQRIGPIFKGQEVQVRCYVKAVQAPSVSAGIVGSVAVVTDTDCKRCNQQLQAEVKVCLSTASVCNSAARLAL